MRVYDQEGRLLTTGGVSGSSSSSSSSGDVAGTSMVNGEAVQFVSDYQATRMLEEIFLLLSDIKDILLKTR
jgi:hypothetical protein